MSQLSSSPSASDIRSALGRAIAQLEREHVPSAPLVAELLLMHTLGCDRAWLYAHPEEKLDSHAYEGYFSLIAQRVLGVPTQYLTGHQEFWGLDFEVQPDVLIPRPETEHVIEAVLERLGVRASCAESFLGNATPFGNATSLRDAKPRDTALRIADVGTGSGCIAVALASEFPNARVVATDVSAAALKVAWHNAVRHNVAQRIDFVHCSLLEVFLQQSVAAAAADGDHDDNSVLFDVIASNPPYIGRDEAATLPREVREHEPETALFAGATGTDIYAPLIAQAGALLKPGGILALELGYKSAEYVLSLLGGVQGGVQGEVRGVAGWSDVSIKNDLAGIARVVTAQRALC